MTVPEAPQGAGNPPLDRVFERPVFIVSPPRSGSTLLFELLARAPALFTIGGESHQLIEQLPGLAPHDSGHDSNVLLPVDARSERAHALRARFHAALRDRDGRPPPAGRVRMLEKTPKNALRIAFFKAVFPEARFVFLHRDVRETLGSMLDAWSSGRFRTYPNLPGWPPPAWSLLLVPGWRSLAGKPLAEIVAAQWQATMDQLLDGLRDLPDGHWCAVDYADLVRDPQAQVERLCDALGLRWDQPLGDALPLSRYTLTRPDADKWRRHAASIEPLLPALAGTIARADAMLAAGRPAQAAVGPAP